MLPAHRRIFPGRMNLATLAQQGLPPDHKVRRVTAPSERAAGWAAAQHRKPSHSGELLGDLEIRTAPKRKVSNCQVVWIQANSGPCDLRPERVTTESEHVREGRRRLQQASGCTVLRARPGWLTSSCTSSALLCVATQDATQPGVCLTRVWRPWTKRTGNPDEQVCQRLPHLQGPLWRPCVSPSPRSSC